MENKKTISYLNGKVWYRLLKIVYILAFVDGFLNFYAENYQYRADSDYWLSIIWDTLLLLFLFELIRRTFYYVVLGKFNPEK